MRTFLNSSERMVPTLTKLARLTACNMHTTLPRPSSGAELIDIDVLFACCGHIFMLPRYSHTDPTIAKTKTQATDLL